MGEWWNRLTPQQRRLIGVGGVGALLGLIVLISRRGTPAPAPAPEEATAETDGNDPYIATAIPSTFADNGAAAGAISSDITDALYAQEAAFYASQDDLKSLEEGLAEQLPALGAGLSGQVGLLSAQVKKLQRQNTRLDKRLDKAGKPAKGGGSKGGKGGGSKGGGSKGGKGGGGKEHGPAGGRPNPKHKGGKK